MTTLTPILYADGALRLTDHGPRGGGVVLVRTDTGEQVDIPAGCSALKYLDKDVATFGPALAFKTLRGYVREWHQRQADRQAEAANVIGSRFPGWHHG